MINTKKEGVQIAGAQFKTHFYLGTMYFSKFIADCETKDERYVCPKCKKFLNNKVY